MPPPAPSPKRSPLHEVHVAAGASFTDFADWEMPVRYESERAEHLAVRSDAGLFDLSHMAQFAVRGTGAAAFCDYAFSGQLSAMRSGRAKYTLLLDESAGILDDLVVYRDDDDDYLVVANAANREAVATALADRAAAFDVTVADDSDRTALIAIQGPRSAEILVALASAPRLTPGSEKLAGLGYYRFLFGTFDGFPLRLARTGYTGEDGFELYLDPRVATELWSALVEAGRDRGLTLCGLASRDTLRLEAGMPLYGHELTRDIRPAQAGLARVVDLAKEGDFVGRAALEHESDATGQPGQAATGSPDARVLVGLAGSGRRPARAGYAVRAPGSDTDVGYITSGASSPTLERPIAMAYVDRNLAEPGTALDIDIRGTATGFTVTGLPFYKRSRG